MYMATTKKKTTKKSVNKKKNSSKSGLKPFLITVLALLLAAGIGLAVYVLVIKGSSKKDDPSMHPLSSDQGEGELVSISFLELGNQFSGDCTFIKAGDVDILIDAGSRKSSVKTIKNTLKLYCKDNKLEYVIATHAHQDHIAGFLGTTTDAGIFDSYTIGTLIDFPRTNATSAIYKDYVAKRDANITEGKIEQHYTADQCIKDESGNRVVFNIAEKFSMTVLDQKYYYEKSSDENNYSVCTLFTHGNNNYLFTGDLEKEGEASLVEMNQLPHCQLFKGGHHGSPTSNTDTLLSVIRPETVCICCCAGNDEYTTNPLNQFPSQTAINNIAKYTDKIYVTTVSTDGHSGYTHLNGNILFYSRGLDYNVIGSNNSIILKDTDWFKENRTWPETT